MDIKGLTAKFMDALLPEKCGLCRRPSKYGYCNLCRPLLPWIDCGCMICGTPLAHPGECGRCQKTRPEYDCAVIPFLYRSPISDHIQKLKYSNRLHYGACLGRTLAAAIIKNTADFPDTIVPVPLHPKRMRTRGYNQSAEISRQIGKNLGIAIDHNVLSRVIDTPKQAELNEKMRELNVKNAFSAHKSRYTHAALVDDVVTSASTVRSAAAELKRSGIKTISIWAVAKT